MQCDKDQEVSVGQTIGTPKMGRILGENKAYIGVKLTYMDKVRDVSIYLSHRDEDIHVAKKPDEIEEESKEEVEVQEIPKPKRKSNKKKK